MAVPSVTYTFSNLTTASATEVNQNFSDIINALTQGTSDLTVGSLITTGDFTVRGDTDLGNATADTISFVGQVDTDIDPDTAASYDFGSATLPWRALYLDNAATDGGAIYFDAGSTEFLKASADGVTLQVGGFADIDSTGAIVRLGTSAKSADYTVLDNDGISVIQMTTGGTTRTVTLPTLADNQGRILTIKRADGPTSGSARIVIEPEGSETIDGATNTAISPRYDNTFNGKNAFITVFAAADEWKIIGTGGDIIYSESTTAWAASATDVNNITVPAGTWRFDLMSYRSAGSADTNISVSLSTTTGTLNNNLGKRSYTFFSGTNTVATTHLTTFEKITVEDVYYQVVIAGNITGGSTGNHFIMATRIV